MKVGFIELETQIQSSNDSLREEIKRTSEELRESVRKSSELTIKALDKFSRKIEAGFLAVEDAFEQDILQIRNEINELKTLKSELDQVKKRLDDANL